MQAIAVTPTRKHIAIIDLPEPQILGPTDVKLRMIEAGVCGTDREICAFEYGTPPIGSESLVIGHESLGEVVEAGAAVTGVRVGDRGSAHGPTPLPARSLQGLGQWAPGLLFHRRLHGKRDQTEARLHDTVRGRR